MECRKPRETRPILITAWSEELRDEIRNDIKPMRHFCARVIQNIVRFYLAKEWTDLSLGALGAMDNSLLDTHWKARLDTIAEGRGMLERIELEDDAEICTCRSF